MQKKKWVDKLVEECSENIDGIEITHNHYGTLCNCCTIYIYSITYRCFFNNHWH